MRSTIIIIVLLLGYVPLNAQSAYSGTGAIDSMYSVVLDEWREFYVRLPEGYAKDTNGIHPVTYILDGEILLPTLSNVHDFYSGGFMPEMILIGISNRKNRTTNLTPVKFDDNAADFLAFIETELIPHIEAEYRVTDYRTLIGHSYGGLFTIYSLINQPQLFTNFLSIDPSLDWGNQAFLRNAMDTIRTLDLSGKSLYVSLSGQLHMQNREVTIENVMSDTSQYTQFSRSNIEFSDIVEANAQNGLEYFWQYYPYELHGTISYPSIKDGMITLFSWFQMEDTDKINSPETTVDELIKIIQHREKKLEDHFGYPVPPYPEFLLTMSGYMNLDMQQPAKSKMYFEQAIHYFPESANTYDSMADYYINQNNFDQALKMVRKAYELSASDYHKKRIAELEEKN